MASHLGLAVRRSVSRLTPRAVAPIVITSRDFSQSTKSTPCGTMTNLCTKLATATPDQKFLASSIALGASIPLGLLFAPTVLAVPFDLVINVALPYHFATGLGHVVDDYVKHKYANYAVYILSALAALGFLKINLCGPGLSASLKSLWNKPRVEKK